MQDRLIEFDKKKKILDEKIETYLKSNESARAWITDKVVEDDREAMASYKKKLSVMKKTDLKEKGIVTNYLLKFKGDSPEPDQDQRNSSNLSRRWRGSPWKIRNGDR